LLRCCLKFSLYSTNKYMTVILQYNGLSITLRQRGKGEKGRGGEGAKEGGKSKTK
jgi:hypothetical protein